MHLDCAESPKHFFEIELKCNPDVGQFLADPIST